MPQRTSLLKYRVDWRSPQQVGRFVGLLWGLTVFGTLTGLLIQAAAGARDWAEVPGAMLPVLLGASAGYGLLWIASVVFARRNRRRSRGERAG